MQVLEVVSGVIVSLGGGAAIVAGCSSWIGKVWADKLMEKEKSKFARELEQLKHAMLRDAESYKIKLKKSEFIFQKEYEAASEFSAMLRRLLPKFKHFLEQEGEWLDDLDKAEARSTDIEFELTEFLKSHGAILDDYIKGEINSCIETAVDRRYAADVLGDCFAGSDIRHIYSRLQYLEQEIINKFRAQSST